MSKSAERIIELLDLKPLPNEGGCFVETYRSSDSLAEDVLPGRYKGERSLSTAIYYMLTPDTFSALHRLPADEIYHFYLGDPVEMLQLMPDGTGTTITLGPALFKHMHLQTLVPAGVWQGSKLRNGGEFALMGTTMAPGFDFADYEGASRDHLVKHYPDFRTQIMQLTNP